MSERGSFGRIAAPSRAQASGSGPRFGGAERGFSPAIAIGPRMPSMMRVGSSPVPELFARLPQQRPLMGNPNRGENSATSFGRNRLQLIRTIPSVSRGDTGAEFIRNLQPFVPDQSQAADRLGGAQRRPEQVRFPIRDLSSEGNFNGSFQIRSEQSARQNRGAIEATAPLPVSQASPTSEQNLTGGVPQQGRETPGILPGAVDIAQKVSDTSAGEESSDQTAGGKAQAELKAREAKKAKKPDQDVVYVVAENDTETSEEEKKKLWQIQFLKRIQMLLQLYAGAAENQEKVKE